MSVFVVDVESDGPAVGLYSMICFGAVKVTEEANMPSFYGQVRPISDGHVPASAAISGFTREQHLEFDDPADVMLKFKQWIQANNSSGRPIFISDNVAYDWQWINYYFHRYSGSNPFGFSGRRIGDLYSGFMRDATKSSDWKKLRNTRHSHNPVDDAMGNAEAILKIRKMGLRLPL